MLLIVHHIFLTAERFGATPRRQHLRAFMFLHVIMLWLLLAGNCWLVLSSKSVAKNATLQIIQKPRYYGVKTAASVDIHCLPTERQQSRVEWYWVAEHESSKTRKLLPGHRENIKTNGNGSTLRISAVRAEDSGVYFCKIATVWGPGTGLKVARHINSTQALYRTRMKDGLIILQGLLLAVCIAAVLYRKRELLERSDSIYEEPETDHIYEGLALETCSGGLYEELPAYADAQGAEAPWE